MTSVNLTRRKPLRALALRFLPDDRVRKHLCRYLEMALVIKTEALVTP
jgi:hypothetical protein